MQQINRFFVWLNKELNKDSLEMDLINPYTVIILITLIMTYYFHLERVEDAKEKKRNMSNHFVGSKPNTVSGGSTNKYPAVSTTKAQLPLFPSQQRYLDLPKPGLSSHKSIQRFQKITKQQDSKPSLEVGVDGMLKTPVTTKDAGLSSNNFVNVGFSSMQGWRPEMEDAHNIILNGDKKVPGVMFFAVFDGHGGQEISRLLGKDMFNEIKATEEYAAEAYEQAIISAALEMDSKMKEMFKDTQSTPGSTANMALIVDKKLFVGNIGDSRCIACINGQAKPLSVDHKPANPEEQKRIKKAGAEVDADDGHLYTESSSLAVSRSMGDFEYKKNQKLGATDQVVSPLADVIQRDIDDSWQFILLACDGIWDELSNDEAVNFVLRGIANGKNPKQICMELCDRCIGSMDNTTCVLVCFLHNKPYAKLVTTCNNLIN